MKGKSTFFSQTTWANFRLLQKMHTLFAYRRKFTNYIVQPVNSPDITIGCLLSPALPAARFRWRFMPSQGNGISLQHKKRSA